MRISIRNSGRKTGNRCVTATNCRKRKTKPTWISLPVLVQTRISNIRTWNLLAETVFCSSHNRFNERLCQAPRHEHHVKTTPSTCHTANKSLHPQGPAELRIGNLKNIKILKQ
ncbi:hypothetical protein RvY_09703 [Ramazzottius varieornatus]|uniref:Uncharacterized protein n=1 Tax=Ramazzottius varieornatus TaxID=947166 RepID=A0A1D1VAB6_RAMVA|nr:hypothetical protein RvY_09703 [Ramazzottius varieornatus]